MSGEAVTISYSLSDIFAEGTIEMRAADPISWRAFKPYPGPDIHVSLWWTRTGSPIGNPSRMAAARKRIIPMLTEAWAPQKEEVDA